MYYCCCRSSILTGYVLESWSYIMFLPSLGGLSNQAGTECWIKYDDSGLKQIGNKHRSECYSTFDLTIVDLKTVYTRYTPIIYPHSHHRICKRIQPISSFQITITATNSIIQGLSHYSRSIIPRTKPGLTLTNLQHQLNYPQNTRR
jgi:hypothetical protein